MGQVESVLAVRNALGEGPVWSSEAETLYWVDIINHCYHQYRPATGEHKVVHVGLPVSALALRTSAGLVMAAGNGFAFWDTDTQRLNFIAEPEADKPHTRFNDGAVDPQGRFWAGTMDEERPEAAEGSLYRLDPDGSVHLMETGVTVSNGIGWSPDNKIMYFTDSMRYVIYAYDYDPATGTLENRRPFIQVPTEEGVPDGLTVDSEGCIWSALWGGWKVIRYDPVGKVEREIKLPVANPTSCTFGGEQLDELYITSAWTSLSEDEKRNQPFAGDLFRSKIGIRGLEEPRFTG